MREPGLRRGWPITTTSGRTRRSATARRSRCMPLSHRQKRAQQAGPLRYVRSAQPGLLLPTRKTLTSTCGVQLRLDERTGAGHAQTNLGKQFSRCNFRHANLRGTKFIGRFEDCDFSSSSLNGRFAVEAKFVRCNFTKAILKGTHFICCKFEDCVWTDAKFGNGSINKSTFIGASPSIEQLGNHLHEGIVLRDHHR